MYLPIQAQSPFLQQPSKSDSVDTECKKSLRTSAVLCTPCLTALSILVSVFHERVAKRRASSHSQTCSWRLILLVQSGAVSEAFKTFKQLHSVDASTASSAAVVGQLAAAALEHDPAAASSLQNHLSSLPDMQAQEVDKLEAAGDNL